MVPIGRMTVAETGDVLLAPLDALAATTSLGQAAEALVPWLCELVDADAGSLGLLGPDHRLEVVATLGLDPAVVERFHGAPVEAPLPITEAIRTRRPVILGSLAERDARYPPLGVDAGIAASASFPLLAGAEVIGVFGVGYATPHEFTRVELARLEAAGHLITLVIDRIRLAQVAQRYRERLEAREWAVEGVADSFRRLLQEREQAAVEQQRASLAAAIDVMLEGAAILAPVADDAGATVDFRFEAMNAAAEDAAGRGRDDLVGRTVREAYEGLDGLVDGYRRVLETGEPLVIADLPYEGRIDDREVAARFHLRAARCGDDRIVITWRRRDGGGR